MWMTVSQCTCSSPSSSSSWYSVLACVFSRDNEMLATGCKDGNIKVWKVNTGECLRKFLKVHNQAISCLAFSKDNLQLVSSSFDSLIR